MDGLFVLDDNRHPVACPDVLKWGLWYEQADRSVAYTTVKDGYLSTVFLAIDHSFLPGAKPLLFETMLFMRDGDCNLIARYATWPEAELGHLEWCEQHAELLEGAT